MITPARAPFHFLEDFARGERELHDVGELDAVVWPAGALAVVQLEARSRTEFQEPAGYLELEGKPASPWQVNAAEEPGPLAVSWWDGAAWERQVDDDVDVDEVVEEEPAMAPRGRQLCPWAHHADVWECSSRESMPPVPELGWRVRQTVLVRFAGE